MMRRHFDALPPRLLLKPSREHPGFLGPALLMLAVASFSAGCGMGSGKSVSADKSTPEEPVAGAAENPAPAPIPPSVTVPSGTNLPVRLLETISSATARPGHEFAAELAVPVVVHDRVIFPGSSRVRGRVVSARESGRLHNPGYLRLTLDAIQAPDGRWINFRTTSVSAKGRSQKKRDVTMIGGVAGLGAVIGGLAGGGKGAAIGAASGAGAGTAAAYATGKRDVAFSAERKLNFATVGAVVVNRSDL